MSVSLVTLCMQKEGDVVANIFVDGSLPEEAFRDKNVIFLCFGTDRSTGDSLGPLVGSYLEGMGFAVVGTLENPLHAMNLHQRIKAEVSSRHTVIAIDSTLGPLTSVGRITLASGSMQPGLGVGKDLGSYGDYRITGCVNVGGFMPYFVLQNTSLHLVMSMAKRITCEIIGLMHRNAYVATTSEL